MSVDVARKCGLCGEEIVIEHGDAHDAMRHRVQQTSGLVIDLPDDFHYWCARRKLLLFLGYTEGDVADEYIDEMKMAALEGVEPTVCDEYLSPEEQTIPF